jgi:hypothetical protein
MSDSSPPGKFRKPCGVAPPFHVPLPSPKQLFKPKRSKVQAKVRRKAARRDAFLKSKFLNVQAKEEGRDGGSVSG